MNQAMALARAAWIAFQDDDDFWFPNALADLYAARMQYSDASLIYGSTRFMDARTGNSIDERFGKPFDLERLRRENILCNNAALVRRDALGAVGGFDESTTLRAFFDWELWIRIGERLKGVHVDALVGEVWGYNPDSVGAKATIDFPAILRRLGRSRILPLKNRLRRTRKIVFLTHRHHPSIRLWRVDYLIDAINAADSTWKASGVEYNSENFDEALENADVLVLYRFHERLPDLAARRRNGMKVVLDLDDPILDDAIPEHIQFADAVSVSTPALASRVARSNVYVRGNGVPLELIQTVDAMPRPRAGRFVVGWLAGLNPNDDVETVINIVRGLSKFDRPTAFYYFGKSRELYNTLLSIGGVEIINDPYVETEDLSKFYARVVETGVAALVAPLCDDTLNRCKAPMKYFDGGILKIPLVASPIGVYSEIIQHGINGFLARTPEAFVTLLRQLEAIPNLAARVGARARSDVLNKYSIRRVADRFLADLDTISDRQGVTREQAAPANAATPLLSIIVVHWNTESFLYHCLQSLREHPLAVGTMEIVVVDNNSDDDAVELVRRRFPEVRVIANRTNDGYSQANNQGAAIARGEYLLFLNPDTEAGPLALDRLITFAKSTPNLGAASAQLRNKDGSVQPSCMRFPTLTTALAHSTFFESIPPFRGGSKRYLMSDFDHNTSREIEQAPGTCLLLPRSVWNAAGGFDPKLFLFFNDVDLCKRIRDSGRAIYFCADAEFVHHGSAAVVQHPDYVTEWHLNRIYYFRKHHGRAAALLAKLCACLVAAREVVRIVTGPAKRRGAQFRHLIDGCRRILRA